jgi:hypothetical protein
MNVHVHGDDAEEPFDASGYSGIRFFARSPEGNTITVKVRTVPTVPVEHGGTCVESDDVLCYDSHAKADIQLGPDWAEHTIRFSELSQEGWGPAEAFDSTLFMGVEFHLTAGENPTFDLWIDDLRFL